LRPLKITTKFQKSFQLRRMHCAFSSGYVGLPRDTDIQVVSQGQGYRLKDSRQCRAKQRSLLKGRAALRLNPMISSVNKSEGSEPCRVARGRRGCAPAGPGVSYLTSNDSQQVASLAESPEVGGAVPQLVLVYLT
jgi:hypothetical protein